MILEGKNVIITGARRGIGRASVDVFALEGANIWACARKKDEEFEASMRDIAKNNKVSIWPVYFDATNETEIKKAVQSIKKQNLVVDVLVNNAGIVEASTSFAMTSMQKMRNVMEVNFFATSLITQYVSRLMIKQNSGSIINIASIAGIDGEPAQYEYVASKAAIIGATKKLARELSEYNIRVNAIAPGVVDTEMGRKLDEGLKQSIISKIIMKRFAEPKEIANVIAFLASDMSSYITAQVIRVDGGM